MLAKFRFSPESFEKKHPLYMGYFYALISSLLSVLGSFFIQKMSKGFSSNQTQYFVGVHLAALSYATTKQYNLPICPSEPKLTKMLILRAISGISGAFFFYRGLPLVPLAEGTVVQMLTPVFTGIFALIFLNEKYDVTLVGSTVLSMIGVLLINKPSFIFGEVEQDGSYPLQTLGLLLLLICAVLQSGSQILLRKLGSISNPFTTSFYLGIGFCISSTIGEVIQGIKTPDFNVYLWVPVIGFVRFITHVFSNKSFALGDAGKISLVSYSQVLFAFIIDIFIVGREIDLYSAIGSFSVFSSVFIMMAKNSKKKDAPIGK